MKAFQYPTLKKPGAGLRTSAISERDVYGTTPKEILPALPSADEGRLYLAFVQAGYKPENIAIQVPIFGGRAARGGQVVDFVIYSSGSAIPIMLNGVYWHRDPTEEFMARAAIWQVWGREPVVIYDSETTTTELAFQTVLRTIGRA